MLGWVLTQRTGVPVRVRDTEWGSQRKEHVRIQWDSLPSSADTTGWLQTWGLPAEEKVGKETAERACKSNCRV